MKYAIYLNITERCNHWGVNWKRHWYNEEGFCYRCGITREDAKNQ